MDGMMTWDDQAGIVPADEKPIEKLKKRSEKFADRVRFNVTRADRIRSLSDEDLAEFLAEYRCVHKAPHCMESNCAQCWFEWLKEEE